MLIDCENNLLLYKEMTALRTSQILLDQIKSENFHGIIAIEEIWDQYSCSSSHLMQLESLNRIKITNWNHAPVKPP